MDSDDARLEEMNLEAAKMRKLEIVFGPWWHHYAVPYEFRFTLKAERAHCPYCGVSLSPISADASSSAEDIQVHLDHMDAIALGGEESIRNVVYVCAPCNILKGRKSFLAWLQEMPVELRAGARAIYSEKHGHSPEEFVASRGGKRLHLTHLYLRLDEAVLKALYPKPIVTGPPERLSRPDRAS